MKHTHTRQLIDNAVKLQQDLTRGCAMGQGKSPSYTTKCNFTRAHTGSKLSAKVLEA